MFILVIAFFLYNLANLFHFKSYNTNKDIIDIVDNFDIVNIKYHQMSSYFKKLKSFYRLKFFNFLTQAG